jgi:predicted dehydrogenase
MEPLRIGILGAARITEIALIVPAKLTGHTVSAVAARSRDRAQEHASAHGIERVLESYRAVIDDPTIDVIYNPLPNGLHGPWNTEALRAGKHVLSEKPSASNAEEARQVRDVQASSSGLFMEAFHYRYHPVMNRMIELVSSGELGDVHHVEVSMGFPLDNPGDPRWDFDLAGGAIMDVGCYAIHSLRTLGSVLGGEPTLEDAKGVSAAHDERVDQEMSADLSYASGATAHFHSSFVVPERDFSMKIEGSLGSAYAHNFCIPSLDDRITVTVGGDTRVENLGVRSSYTYQLEAFAAHVRDGSPIYTDAKDAVVQSEFMDACYAAAGFPLRPVSTL